MLNISVEKDLFISYNTQNLERMIVFFFFLMGQNGFMNKHKFVPESL